MSREFGLFSPSVELFTTWEEDLQLTDDAGPVDITGLHIVAQLRLEVPTVLPAPDPVLELTTPGYHTVPPATYDSLEAFSIVSALDGHFHLTALPDEYSEIVSPTNAKTKLRWDIKLVASSGHSLPVVRGKVTFKPATTIP